MDCPCVVQGLVSLGKQAVLGNLGEAVAVGADGCHDPGAPCLAAPPAACPLQRWVFEGSVRSDGGHELVFFER